MASSTFRSARNATFCWDWFRYGVDIDAQAVEVCQLSLYLRLLKEETTGSTHQYLLDFAHTAQMKKLLLDLSKNIVRGDISLSGQTT